jgi:hypothetical protein
VLFSQVAQLSPVSPDQLNTRLNAMSMLASFIKFLEATKNLGLSIDRFDEVAEQATMACDRLIAAFEADGSVGKQEPA